MNKGSYFIVFGLLLFLPAFFTTLIEEHQIAEVIGNVIYGSFFVGLIFKMVHFFREEKKEMKK